MKGKTVALFGHDGKALANIWHMRATNHNHIIIAKYILAQD